MIILVSQIIFVLSILGILFIILRKIPALLEYPRHRRKEISTNRFFHDFVIPNTEKVLRKTKTILLKFDNFLARKADNLRAKIRKRKREKKGEGTPG